MKTKDGFGPNFFDRSGQAKALSRSGKFSSEELIFVLLGQKIP